MIDLKKKFKFIVIGGWAAYLWTNLHKSKDIDIAMKNFDDLHALKNKYSMSKNDNLKRYEIKIDEIDIDIYVPFFSKLPIPIEDLSKYSTVVEGFEVVKPEILLILKQGAEFDREKSVKGQKDRIDIVTLLCFTEIDFGFYNKILKQYKIGHYSKRLKSIIQNFTEIKYLDLNPREFKLKKKDIMLKFQ